MPLDFASSFYEGGTKMKKVFSPAAILFLLLFMEQLSFAKKVCLQDNFFGYWELSGGRVGKKTFTARLILPGFCQTGGYADITRVNSNTLLISLFNSHDINGTCVPVLWSATTNADFEGSGSYDTLADGSTEGTFTLTKVNCSSIPSAAQIDFSKTSNPVVRKE
jgi:hypothetical protein